MFFFLFSMVFHGFLSFSLVFHGFLLLSVGFCMIFNGFLSVPRFFYGFLSCSMVFYGFLRFSMVSVVYYCFLPVFHLAEDANREPIEINRKRIEKPGIRIIRKQLVCTYRARNGTLVQASRQGFKEEASGVDAPTAGRFPRWRFFVSTFLATGLLAVPP